MKRTRKYLSYLPEAAALAVSLVCVLLITLIHMNPGFTLYSNAVTPYLILRPDSVREEAIPDYAGIRRTYAITLPDSKTVTTTGARLTFYLRHTIAQFEVEDSTIKNDMAEDDSPHIGRTPGNYWVSIPVRPAYAGKTAQITLTPVYPSVRDEEPTFLVITKDALLNMLELPRDGLMLRLSLVAVTAGLFLALLVFALPLTGREKRIIFYLGAVTVTAGVWKLCGLPSVTLLLDYWGCQKEIWFAGAVSYLLMMILSLRLLTVMGEDRENAWGNGCFYISALLGAALLLLQMLNAVELHQTLIWYGIIVAGLHFAVLLKRRPGRFELLWALPFFLTLGIDLLVYRISGSLRGAPVFLIWCILNLFVRGFSFVRGAILRERVLRKQEEELRDAKIKTMMIQIRPHFIYNTLSSIYVLCMDDPKQAMQVIQDFTDYLRANFTALNATELIAFSDELRHVKAYVAVESLRYGEKLRVEYDTKHTAFRLPPLTLQPLVENSIKHCLGKGIGPERIVIRTWAEKNGAFVSVEDDGPGFTQNWKEDDDQHVGIENVRERLRLMCGGTMEIRSDSCQGTVITIFIPVSNNESGQETRSARHA